MTRTPKTSAEAMPPAVRATPASPVPGPAGSALPLGGTGQSSPPLPEAPRKAAAGAPSPVTGTVAPSRVTTPARGRSQSPAGASLKAHGSPPAGSTAIAAMAAAMTEDRGRDSLEARMRRIMKDLGLWGYHPRRSEKSEKGWPDWVIIGTRIIYRELKTERGDLSPEQERVRDRILTAGGDWGLWRPMDLLTGRITEELRAIAAGPLGSTRTRREGG